MLRCSKQQAKQKLSLSPTTSRIWSTRRANKFKVDPKRALKGVDAYKEVTNSNVDAVLLVAPPGYRPDHFKAAVAAKKHIFAEKPLAVDVPGCHEVLDAGERARKQNLTVVVGLQRHYSKAYRECKKLIDQGALGNDRDGAFGMGPG